MVDGTIFCITEYHYVQLANCQIVQSIKWSEDFQSTLSIGYSFNSRCIAARTASRSASVRQNSGFSVDFTVATSCREACFTSALSSYTSCSVCFTIFIIRCFIKAASVGRADIAGNRASVAPIHGRVLIRTLGSHTCIP